MFLAFFPFSEVVCLISVVMAWLYIGLGFLGNCHAPDINGEKTVSANEVQSALPLVSETDNYFWFENKILSNLDAKTEDNNYKTLVPVFSLKKIDLEIPIALIHFNRYKPNRAPPAFS